MDVGDLEKSADGVVRLEVLRDFLVGDAKDFVVLRLHTGHRTDDAKPFEDRFLQMGMTVEQARLLTAELQLATDRAARHDGGA